MLDDLYRQVLGWPVPRTPKRDEEIVDDLRQMLRDRRAAQERRRRENPPLPGTKEPGT
ncbi:MAG: hypothetical protein ACJ76I_12035 [Gaiellaceae bacterium]